jgi:hypothetical protein
VSGEGTAAFTGLCSPVPGPWSPPPADQTYGRHFTSFHSPGGGGWVLGGEKVGSDAGTLGVERG